MQERTESRLTDADTGPTPADDDAAGVGARRKPKSVFVTDPGAPTAVAAVDLDEFGRPRKHIVCEDPEAATQWDSRLWRRLR
jgi:hypothetical protein